MSKIIELSSGKILDLAHFVALIPNDITVENHSYSLILVGYSQPINLNSQEVDSIKKYLQLDSEKIHNGAWDREEQIRKNKPKLKLLKERIERMKQEQPSAEKAAYFDSFKQTIDAERPTGQKLYEH
ncbi:MAG: hypothetical protein ACRC06_17125 [Waterburya sp.]